jgi:hypothetical protein
LFFVERTVRVGRLRGMAEGRHLPRARRFRAHELTLPHFDVEIAVRSTSFYQKKRCQSVNYLTQTLKKSDVIDPPHYTVHRMPLQAPQLTAPINLTRGSIAYDASIRLK